MPPPMGVSNMKSVSDMLYTDKTYMNQNIKMARATPNAAITIMTKITPAMVPAGLL